MTSPKAERLVKHARDLFAYLGKKYSMSLQHVAETDDWIERLERFIGETDSTKADRVR